MTGMPHWHCDFEHERPQNDSKPPRLRTWLPPLNFITLHYAYFIIVPLVASVVFWASSHPARSISYADSLFVVVSAMTETGLNTVNLSRMTTWQQTILFLLIIFGSSIWVSIWTVLARKHAFERRFQDIVRAERLRRTHRAGSAVSLPRLQNLLPFRRASTRASQRLPVIQPRRENEESEGMDISAVVQLPTVSAVPIEALMGSVQPPLVAPGSSLGATMSPARIAFVDSPRPQAGVSTASQYSLEENQTALRHRIRDPNGESHGREKEESGMRQILAYRSGGRNAQFHGLTSEERDRLGGCEYQALRVLSIIVPLYFVLWQLLGCLALGAWISNHHPGPPLENGINPWWLGIFNGVSAFNNSGMSLLDANMIPFQQSTFVLLTMGLLILAGNTAYPVFLRLIIWSLLRILKVTTGEDQLTELKDTFRFILQYPRRVYTNLFPARPTWWLVFMLILLNSIDWVGFELLNLGNPKLSGIPLGSRVLDGLFQALAVRSGGFYVVPITSVYIGLQVLYVVMMYISVYPVVITMRHSNVYEERSLGIYAEDEIPTSTPDPELGTSLSTQGHHPHRRASSIGLAATLGRAIGKTFAWNGVGARPPPSARQGGGESRISFITQQIHGQLAHDIWWLVLTILIIVTINTGKFLADPVNFSVFNVIFEVVSAYGCVGISVGVPYDAFSFSGSWHTASKIVLCAVMIRGRHRGLPVALDRAVRLPGEELHRDEEEDHWIRRSVTNRRASVGTS